MGPSPFVLEVLQGAAEWLRLILAACGGAALLWGVVASLAWIVRTPRSAAHTSAGARLQLARYLALALEFQLAADVVETSVSPNWTKIGRLAAIAAIRTALNYFLAHDMAEDRRLLEERRQDGQASGEVISR
jgi:uncharacterized membrane protein